MARKKPAVPAPDAPLPAIVQRAALSHALAALKPLCGGTLTILHHVLAETAGGELTLKATDLDLTLSIALPLEEPAGQLAPCLLPLDRLLAFVKSSWQEAVALSLDGGQFVVEAGATARFAKLRLTPEDYPELPLAGGSLPEQPAAIFTRDMWEAVKVAASFTNAKEPKGDQLYVFGRKGPEPEEGQPFAGTIDIYGVKGFSAFRRRGLPAGDIEDFRAELEPRTVQMLAGLDWTTCRLHIGERHLLFEGQGFALAQRKLEGVEWDPTPLWSAEEFHETSVINLLPGIEAVAGLQEGKGSVLGIDPLPACKTCEGEGEVTEDVAQAGDQTVTETYTCPDCGGLKARAFVQSDAVSGSADLAAYFPPYRCNYGDELLRCLRAVDGHGAVRVGEMVRRTPQGLRAIGVQFEAEDGTSALMSGIWEKEDSNG